MIIIGIGSNLSSSALTALYEALFLNTSYGSNLAKLSEDRGLSRPPVFMGDDNGWRAIAKLILFSRRHVRPTIESVVQTILHPNKYKLSVLDRNYFPNVLVGATLTILPPSAFAGAYTVGGVRKNELVFPASPFVAGAVPSADFHEFSIQGITSKYGRILIDEFGQQVFRDTTVSFVNDNDLDLLLVSQIMNLAYCVKVLDKYET